MQISGVFKCRNKTVTRQSSSQRKSRRVSDKLHCLTLFSRPKTKPLVQSTTVAKRRLPSFRCRCLRSLLLHIRFASPRNSGTQVLNGRPFDSPCRPRIYLPRKMKVEPDLSLVRQALDKIRVLQKSRNRCKLSLFRFHYSVWFLYFYTFPNMWDCLWSESFKLQSF